MKRFFGIIILLSICLVPVYSQTQEDIEAMMSELEDSLIGIMDSVTSNISWNMNNSMQTYIGAGNVYPLDVSPFLGIKFGAGIGLNMSSIYRDLIDATASGNTNAFEEYFGSVTTDPNASELEAISTSLGQFISLFPFPYDLAYFKIGLPEGMLILPFLKNVDIGVRIGVLPNIADFIGSYSEGGLSAAFSTGGFHFGVEARTLLIGKPRGAFNVDARVSWDMDFGHIGMEGNFVFPLVGETNNSSFSTISSNTAGIRYSWRGTSLGFKVIAGLRLPIIQAYGGLGLNFNVGSVNSHMYLRGDVAFTGLPEDIAIQVFNYEQETRAPFDFAELFAIAGLRLFGFFQVGLEYSLTRGNLALTILPVALSF